MPFSVQRYTFKGGTSVGELCLLLALLPLLDSIQWRSTTESILRERGMSCYKGPCLDLKSGCCGYMECALHCREPQDTQGEFKIII